MVSPFPRHAPAAVRHSAWLVDLAFAVLTVVGVTTGALAAGVRGPWNGLIPLALFLGALLMFRRRWPLTVLLLSIAAIFLYRATSVFEGGWIWPASVAYVSAACTPRVRWVALIGAAQLVYATVDFWWVLERNAGRFLIHIVGEGLLLAILIAAGTGYATAMSWRERLRETDGRARAAEERLRAAREVHDIVAHTLAVVGVQLNVASDTLKEAPDEAAAALRVAKDVRNRAMADLTSLIGVLRDSTAPQPDLAALGTLIEDARAAGLQVTLDQRGDPATIPAAQAVAVYRIVQEALTNTLKHAGAAKAEVTIERRPSSITVEVEDDGRGCAEITESHGLAGMRERVNALGGTLTVDSKPGGFSIRADLPVAGSHV
ncbi:Signal transduction histidine kinase [Nonomuraea solani]|uniref:histidine kinase n=1 Tax=Nonomuraea solani TaxID=1144553 RepID=A0A1H6EW95_9ACTN|nr:sensor histidine kinase [Nonomuraea solani]SEH01129.1 Signal transduction histidine kinase [Nonomuraea solani]